MVVDPALSTLQFVERAVRCEVVESRAVQGEWEEGEVRLLTLRDTAGLSNCSRLSSCREGCTQGQAACHYIMVEFSHPMETVITSSADHQASSRAHLKVNAKGCGYAPSVNCSEWIEEFGEKGETFDCHYSE